MRTQTAKRRRGVNLSRLGLRKLRHICPHGLDASVILNTIKLWKKYYLFKKGRKEQKSVPCKRVLSMRPCVLTKIEDLETILFITTPFIDVLCGTSHTGDLWCLHGQTVLLFASAYSDDSLIPLRFILLLDTEELVFVRNAVLSEVAALIALSPTPFGVRCFVHYVKDHILLCVARKVVGNEVLNLAGACLLYPFVSHGIHMWRETVEISTGVLSVVFTLQLWIMTFLTLSVRWRGIEPHFPALLLLQESPRMVEESISRYLHPKNDTLAVLCHLLSRDSVMTKRN